MGKVNLLTKGRQKDHIPDSATVPPGEPETGLVIMVQHRGRGKAMISDGIHATKIAGSWGSQLLS